MLSQIRDDIVSLLSGYTTAYPNIPLYYDNQQVDWNNPGEVFCTVEIKFYDGAQIGMSRDPRTRFSGYVYVTAATRTGTGSRHLLDLIGWFAWALGYKSVGRVQLQAPEPDGSDAVKGWFKEEIKIAFHADPA